MVSHAKFQSSWTTPSERDKKNAIKSGHCVLPATPKGMLRVNTCGKEIEGVDAGERRY